MQILVKKFIFLLFVLFFSLVAYAGSPHSTNFLPLGDSYAASRSSDYGATIENNKPYRQTVPVEESNLSGGYSFGTSDIFICILLFGVYIVFKQKKSRNAGL